MLIKPKRLQYSLKGNLLVAMLMILIANYSFSQNGVAINTTGATANNSAMLDVASTTGGILVPRMTSTQRIAISSPATSLLVYQTDASPGFYYYNGSAWIQLAAGSGGVTNVTASSPLSSTGGATPNISITNPLPVANGGTNGTAVPTNGGIAYGTGTAYAFSPAGTSGQVLTSNGAGAPLWTTPSSSGGPLGQTAVTVYGNGSTTTIIGDNIPLDVPGLNTSITVPSTDTYIAYISTDGGIQTTSGSMTGFSACMIAVSIDGAATPPPKGGYKVVTALNNGGFTTNLSYWSISFSVSLSPGPHTISVFAQDLGYGSPAIVGGDESSLIQPELTVLLLKL